MPTEDAYSSGHLVLSHFGTCMCSNVETNLSWTCLVSGLLNFEHHSVLLFCFELHRITSCFNGAFATGVACQQGKLTLPDTWFRPQFWDLLMLKLLRPNSSNLPCLYSTFHIEYHLVLSRFCFVVISLFRSEKTTIFVISPRNNEQTKWHKSATINSCTELYFCPNYQSFFFHLFFVCIHTV